MKKILLSIVFVAIIMSCQDKTKDKLEDAKNAVTEEVNETIDSAKIKTKAKLDSVKEKAKTKMDSAIIKSASKMEEAAKKLKESVKK